MVGIFGTHTLVLRTARARLPFAWSESGADNTATTVTATPANVNDTTICPGNDRRCAG
jgi:predicted membrane-bound mannosyltransferase